MLIMGSTASAVTYSDKQDQTVDGQDFLFEFDVLLSDGSDGSFTIEARGDYFGKDEEYLGFSIEDIFFQNRVTAGEVTYKPGYESGDDRWWMRTWIVPGSDLQAITSDSEGNIEIDLFCAAKGVNVVPNAFVGVELSYSAVPIPGTILLLGGGLAGLAGIRFGRRKPV